MIIINNNIKQLVIIDTAAAPALYVVSQWAILQFFLSALAGLLFCYKLVFHM